MQFIDLKKQYSILKSDIDQNINTVLEHASFIMGPEIKELEKQLSDFVGISHCVTCSSGTDALLMPLMAWDIGPGDAVFTIPFTFIATAEVVSLLGATPIFVDIDPKTYNMDPELLEKAIEDVKRKGEFNPKAILPVDLFGLPAEYDAIMEIAKKHDLLVLEDGAQGFGGSIDSRKACSFGHAASTSFFPAKPLGCYGDGGAVFTNDDELFNKLTSIRVHGKGCNKYDNIRIGLNGRLDTIQAAILLVKLKAFPEEIKSRNKVASKYSERLNTKVVTPTIPDGYISAWAQYSVLAKDSKHRNDIQKRLKENDVPSAIYYIKPLHLQDAFSELGYKPGDFPASEDSSNRIFSLPMHPYLTDEEIDLICDVF